VIIMDMLCCSHSAGDVLHCVSVPYISAEGWEWILFVRVHQWDYLVYGLWSVVLNPSRP